MFIGIAFKFLLNIGALWVAGRYIPGFQIMPMDFIGQFSLFNPIGRIVSLNPALQGFSLPFSGISFAISPVVQTIVAGGILLAVLNAVLYPLLKVAAAILPFITTPMLLVAANGILLSLAASSLAAVAIDGFKPLLLVSLLLGVVNALP